MFSLSPQKAYPFSQKVKFEITWLETIRQPNNNHDNKFLNKETNGRVSHHRANNNSRFSEIDNTWSEGNCRRRENRHNNMNIAMAIQTDITQLHWPTILHYIRFKTIQDTFYAKLILLLYPKITLRHGKTGNWQWIYSARTYLSPEQIISKCIRKSKLQEPEW